MINKSSILISLKIFFDFRFSNFEMHFFCPLILIKITVYFFYKIFYKPSRG